ncbi:MAG: type II toxin-antitoxin system VapC family toxin [Pseudomonadota bacterium]
MKKVFFDTSAFVKRYVNESGSQRVIEICRQADELAMSIISPPEVISTLCRLVREGTLSAEEYEQTKAQFLTDLENVTICDITPEVMMQTTRCLENHTLRAMDAIHLGCALCYASDSFVSSDHRQIQAALGMGLEVVEI